MPKGANLKIGRIVSKIGNEIVASFPDSGIPKDLKTACRLYGRKVSLGNSKKGRISDIIGGVESPYLVVKLNKK